MAHSSQVAAKPRRRGAGRPFRKGQSGNPGGRAKRDPTLAARCRDLTDACIARLQSIMEKGEDKDANAAVKTILAYGHGMPKEEVKLDGDSRLEVLVRYVRAGRK